MYLQIKEINTRLSASKDRSDIEIYKDNLLKILFQEFYLDNIYDKLEPN